jgi:hypothetical protein
LAIAVAGVVRLGSAGEWLSALTLAVVAAGSLGVVRLLRSRAVQAPVAAGRHLAVGPVERRLWQLVTGSGDRESGLPAPPVNPTRLQLWAQRHPWLTGLIAGAIMAGLAAATCALGQGEAPISIGAGLFVGPASGLALGRLVHLQGRQSRRP